MDATTIHKLRFGFLDIRDKSNLEIVELMEFNLSADVMALCQREIDMRRSENLEKKRHDTEP